MPEEFEAPLIELEKRIEDLARQPATPAAEQEMQRLRRELDAKRRQIFAGLTPWQKTLVARHPARPYTLDYVNALFTEFAELHGDRRFADDPALVCGFAFYKDKPVAVVGHQKGRDTKQKIYRNFGMPKPEGYRKALRIMKLAEKFSRPIITFVDTPGAYPGLDAEERGQAEAIARSTEECLALGVPLVTVIVGEGGSGGAVAIASANRVLMFEHAIYSVISPEGCASILWRTADKAAEAAEAMKITAQDQLALGVIDRIVPEPLGGAHRDPDAAIGSLKGAIVEELDGCAALGPDKLRAQRRAKYLAIG